MWHLPVNNSGKNDNERQVTIPRRRHEEPPVEGGVDLVEHRGADSHGSVYCDA